MLLIVSPMCTAVSVLQNLNYSKKSPEEVKNISRRAIKHVAFAIRLCEMQDEAGRYFVYEHSKTAKS